MVCMTRCGYEKDLPILNLCSNGYEVYCGSNFHGEYNAEDAYYALIMLFAMILLLYTPSSHAGYWVSGFDESRDGTCFDKKQ